MLLAKTGFWNFESSSKIDVLVEGPHTHQILRALCDRETRVEPEGTSFVLYGDYEALLVKPHSFPVRVALLIVSSFLSVFQTQ